MSSSREAYDPSVAYDATPPHLNGEEGRRVTGVTRPQQARSSLREARGGVGVIADGGVMSRSGVGTYDPSARVRRVHLPI